MDQRRAGECEENEAGRAFVQEARESLGMGRFLLPEDSRTLGRMAHTLINLSTIAEEEHGSPKEDNSIPKTDKNFWSVDSVVKNDSLDGVVENETHNDQHDRSTFGTTTDSRELWLNHTNAERASAMDRRLLAFRSRRWTLGSSIKEPSSDMSTTPSTTFTLEEPRIVLQGLCARFEESSSKIPLLGNYKAPAPPQRQKSRRNDIAAERSLDDEDEKLIVENEAISTEQGSPWSNDHRQRNDSSPR
jgi:hypothetical protein